MDATKLIEMLGGTFAVASLTKVKPPSVSGWKETNRIPENQLMRLAPIAEARGITTRKDLFPIDWQEIWPELASPSPPPAGIEGDAPAEPSLDDAMAAAAQASLVERRSQERLALEKAEQLLKLGVGGV